MPETNPQTTPPRPGAPSAPPISPAQPAPPPPAPAPGPSAPPAPSVQAPAPQPSPKPPPHHIKPKVGRNVLTCWTYGAVIGLLAVSAVLYVTAKTGLFAIPVFSRAYAGPVPTRTVKTEAMTSEAFRQLLGSRLAAQASAGRTPPFAVRLTESELSAGLRQGIEAALRDESWKQVSTQVVVEPTEIELLGRFARGWIKLDALIRFVPRMRDGGAVFEPIFVQVGDYRLSPHIAYQLLGYLFSRDLGSWVVKFGDLQLSDLHLNKGYLELRISPAASRP